MTEFDQLKAALSAAVNTGPCKVALAAADAALAAGDPESLEWQDLHEARRRYRARAAELELAQGTSLPPGLKWSDDEPPALAWVSGEQAAASAENASGAAK